MAIAVNANDKWPTTSTEGAKRFPKARTNEF